MLAGQLALIVAALFSGAAVYINIARRHHADEPTAHDDRGTACSVAHFSIKARTMLGFAATLVFLWASMS